MQSRTGLNPVLSWSCPFCNSPLNAMPHPAVGHLGASLMPGSSTVLDRSTDTMVPCTLLNCPFATPQVFDMSYFVDPSLIMADPNATTISQIQQQVPFQPDTPYSPPTFPNLPGMGSDVPPPLMDSFSESWPPLVNRAPFSTLADLLADTSDAFLANSTGQKVLALWSAVGKVRWIFIV